ncbi:MAG: hypothetical protein FJX59_14175 [Alphaproteobacteria bacterium]|nr:hypothetical protein [Alphaproteobacteria bacterium]
MNSTIKPFGRGDVFVGATLLNNPADDHAGQGRIIQYDADLNEKGVLWVEGTTHLIGGLTFDADGTMWAFDNLEWLMVKIAPDGRQIYCGRMVERATGKVAFLANGHYVLTEYFKGDAQPQTLTTRYKTLPGKLGQVGTGLLWEFDAAGKLVRTHEPEVHGGVSRSMAVTHAALASDGRTLIYTSETGTRVMRYDVIAAKQLPDLMVLPASEPGRPPNMVFDVATDGGKVLLPLGNRLEVRGEDGAERARWPLPGFGWALVAAGIGGDVAYVANWFSGDVVKLSLTDGSIGAKITIAPKSLSGLVQFAR